MFEGLLDKEMEWYDLRQDGIGSLLIRMQTYVQSSLFLHIPLTFQSNSRAPISSLTTNWFPGSRNSWLHSVSWTGFLLVMEANTCYHFGPPRRDCRSVLGFSATLSSC
jgi:hypothetical protein